MKKILSITLLLVITLFIISACARANYPTYSIKSHFDSQHWNIKVLNKNPQKDC